MWCGGSIGFVAIVLTRKNRSSAPRCATGVTRSESVGTILGRRCRNVARCFDSGRLLRASTRWLSALICIAAVPAGCGASAGGAGPNSTSRLRAQAPDAVKALAANTAGQLARFPQSPVPTNSRLPPPPRAQGVERAYLIALFDDAQSVWRHEFVAARLRYKPARLVIFWSRTKSRCGPHDDSGPFYCPTDRGVYLDLRFFSLLLSDSHVGAAAQAYIVGHELGHHVQRLIGIADLVDAANHAAPSGKNGRSVQVELEADCLAGVWAHSAYPRSELSVDELYEALKAAHVLGDDYLMQAAGNVVDRALFTHGSSLQRKKWLRAGYQTGRPNTCNPFEGG